MPIQKPRLLTPNFDGIPDELKNLPRWVLWVPRWVEKPDMPEGGKWSKVPKDPKTGGDGSSTNSETWSDFNTARTAYERNPNLYGGVGFVLYDEDEIMGGDIDGCMDGDTLTPAAALAVANLPTYWEMSPSGRGLRFFAVALKPPGGCKSGATEMYSEGRYLTVTGRHWPASPRSLAHCQKEVEALHAKWFPQQQKKNPAAVTNADPVPLSVDDTELLSIALKARNGTKVGALYAGDTSANGGDPSAADLALCSCLAYWTGPDPDRLSRLFEGSALMREKWHKRHFSDGRTYGQATVQKAIAGCSRFHDWSKRPLKDVKQEQKRQAHVSQADSLPVIETNARHIREITSDALDAMMKANKPPAVFVRDGQLAHIPTNEKGDPSIEQMSLSDVRSRLARVANFVSTSEKRGTVPVAPSINMAEDLQYLVKMRGDWSGIPPIETVTAAPVVGPRGDLVTTPGYHPEAKIFYHPRGGELPNTDPTPEKVARAKKLIFENLLADFPFADDSSRAHAVALLLVPFVRPMINGPTPLHLIDAPVQGTGKSLLAESVGSIFANREVTATALPAKGDEDEMRKQITSALLSGTNYIWFDNLKYPMNSGQLAGAITAPGHTDRLLGGNKSITLPVRCTWVLTGNNIDLDGDFPRRSVWIRLDAGLSRPEDRNSARFAVPNLRQWIADNRAELIGACLTLIRAWLEGGQKPWSGKPLASFENWSRVIGGILECVGIYGLLENREELYQRTSSDRDQWAQFFDAWHQTHGPNAVPVADVFDLAVELGLAERREGQGNSARISFGRQLGGQVGKVYDNLRLERAGKRQRAAYYRVNVVNIMNVPTSNAETYPEREEAEGVYAEDIKSSEGGAHSPHSLHSPVEGEPSRNGHKRESPVAAGMETMEI